MKEALDAPVTPELTQELLDTPTLLDTQKSETIDSSIPSQAETQAIFDTLAKRVATKGDALDDGPKDTQFAGKTIIGGATFAAGIAVAALEKNVSATAASFVLVGGCALWGALSTKHRAKRDPGMELPNGSRLQCVRAKDKAPGIDKGDIVTVVHPKPYLAEKNEYEPPALARTRLKQALAVASNSEHVDKVMIPESTARYAGLYIDTELLFNKTVQAMVGRKRPVFVPHVDSERAILVSREKATEMLRHLDDKGDVLGEALTLLATRFPLVADKLHAGRDAEELRTTLRTIIDRVATADLPSTSRRRSTDQTGVYTDERRPLQTSISYKKDKGNPRITQADSQTLANEFESDLKSMAGVGNAEAKTILLHEHATDLQIATVALSTLEAGNAAQDTAASTPERAMSDDFKGVRPYIHIPVSDKDKRSAYGFIAAVPPAVFAVAAMLGPVLNENQQSQNSSDYASSSISSGIGSASPNTSSNERPWKIASNGMPTEGYYAVGTDYTLDMDTKTWSTTTPESASMLALPSTIDPSVPYITVDGYVKGGASLPIKVGTQLGSLRVHEATSGAKPVTTKTYQLQDGEIYIDTPDDRLVRVSYELVENNEADIKASSPLQVDTKGIEPAMYPGAVEGAGAQANNTANTFTYDNTENMDSLLSENGETAKEFVDAVYAEQRCNCNVCATAVGAVQAAAHPHEHLAFTKGYAGVNNGYLTAQHAWLTDGEGSIIDPTAIRQDANSGQADAGLRKAELDKLWTEGPSSNQNSPDGRMLLAATAITGALIEKRYKLGRRGVVAATKVVNDMLIDTKVDRDKAAKIMGFEAFSAPGTPLPYDWDAVSTSPNVDFIPSEVLVRLADNDTHGHDQLAPAEAKGIRLLAKQLLRERAKEQA